MTDVLTVSCDEAGHTGPDLLQKEQRYFSFASVSVEDEEAWQLIQKAVKDYKIQMPELKAARLMKIVGGRALISDLVKAAEGRFAINAHDKLLALCGWVFEYIYEPVYRKDPSLLYRKNFHRFVAMFTYIWFSEVGGNGEAAVRQFQKYMRTLDENEAPLLFNQLQRQRVSQGTQHPFELILRFARGYRNEIVKDNARINKVLPEAGKWAIDLSTSALWSHLNFWGRTGKPLIVQCDNSKPIQANIDGFKGDESDPGIIGARMSGAKEALGYKLAKPITFVDSRNHPAVQLADVVAGTLTACLTHGTPEGFDETVKRIEAATLRDSIFPNYEIVDLNQRAPAVNYLMLIDLAERADERQDPHVNLEAMYYAAEASWAKGDFKPD